MKWIEIIFWLCSFLVVYTNILYPVLLFGLSFFKSRPRKMDQSHLPTVSMLIAAHNEQEIIAEKIENCIGLDYPRDKLEIIIGSDASTDRTDEIVREHGHACVRLVSFAERRGKASVLNDLAGLARGEVLIFSDANSIYRQDAILRLVPHFADQQVGGVCGQLVLLNQNGYYEAEGERFYWNYENELKRLEGKIKTVLGANGAIYAIRRELFKSLPKDKVVTDDFLIPLNIVQHGFDVVYDAEAVVYEYAAPTLKLEFQRKVRIGAANFNGIREILPLLNPARGFVAFGLWSHKIIRWFVPFFLLIALLVNLFLLPQFLYQVTFAVQMCFYALAVLSWRLSKFGRHASVFILPYYFVVTNLALLVGFFKFLTKSQKPAWTKVER
ncbi:MAG: glycosyltransferase family 2 protein [bacterium]